MTRSRLILLTITITLVAAATVTSGLLLLRSPSEPANRGPIIARVGGAPIYLEDARSRVAGLGAVHEDMKATLGEDWADKVLRSLADDVVIQKAADDEGVEVTSKQLQAALGETRSNFKTESAYEQWLSSNGMSPAELERRIHLQVLSSAMYLHVTDGINATSAQINDYYHQHQSDFGTGEGVTPLLEVRRSIKDIVDKEQKDAAFADWLDEQRSNSELVVVMENWSEQL
jgi:hypothetical protein